MPLIPTFQQKLILFLQDNEIIRIVSIIKTQIKLFC